MSPIDFGVTRSKFKVREAYVSFDISCLSLAHIINYMYMHYLCAHIKLAYTCIYMYS